MSLEVQYTPETIKTYTQPQHFKVYCRNTNTGMSVSGDQVRFVGYNGATAQWDERGLNRENLTIQKLQEFIKAYEERDK